MTPIKEFRGEIYQYIGYMEGLCPGCKEWEAPITMAELLIHPDLHATHVGSSPRVRDTATTYYRETWQEFFKCPVCQTRFTNQFSNT